MVSKGGTMANEQKSKNSSGLQSFLFIIAGSVLALIGTIITNLWLIPAQEKRIHKYELAEQKVSKLYQPILFSTGYGNVTMTSDIPFYKVKRILENYGYLADQEVIEKFLEFQKLCVFADYDELVERTDMKGIVRGLPDSVLVEILKTGNMPLKWHTDSLESALKVEKEFQEVLSRYYKKAYDEFMNF
jgi:hypothetical protein